MWTAPQDIQIVVQGKLFLIGKYQLINEWWMIEFEYYHFTFPVEIIEPGNNNKWLIQLWGENPMGSFIMVVLN